MTNLRPALVSVDVGGTLGISPRPGITAALVAASPLPRPDAIRIIRQRLHTVPAITDALIAELCEALDMPVTAFPYGHEAAPLELFPLAPAALKKISALLPVVTLSNVACVDAASEQLRELLSPWVSDFFPSHRIGYAKPDPRAFTTLAARCGVNPGRIVHIGDHWECDVLGALHAGAHAIWISGDRTPPSAGPIVTSNVQVATDIGAAADLVRELCTRRTS